MKINIPEDFPLVEDCQGCEFFESVPLDGDYKLFCNHPDLDTMIGWESHGTEQPFGCPFYQEKLAAYERAVKKVRRRIEDFLRKTNHRKIAEVAQSLGISTEVEL